MVLVILGVLLLLLGGAGIVFGLTFDFASVDEASFLAKLGENGQLAFLVVGVTFAVIGLVMLIIGLTRKTKVSALQLAESAIMIAIAAVLSELVKIPSPLGGGLTFLSMLPIIMISHRYGAGWGLFTAFIYSLLQLVFGLKNIGYATGAVMVVGVMFLDYMLAYTVLGLSGIFGKSRGAVATGIAVTFTLRFACHLVAGAWIWGEWMPEEYMGMVMKNPWIYSALYNGWYMLAELIITMFVAMLLYKPLEKYFRGASLKKAA